jgi:hypothetical protein
MPGLAKLVMPLKNADLCHLLPKAEKHVTFRQRQTTNGCILDDLSRMPFEGERTHLLRGGTIYAER